MLDGLFTMPWWGYLLVLLALTHVTIVAVTVFLHRAQAHRSVRLHPLLSHGFRLWLWLTTGMVTREWVAVHRKHHAHCEGDHDPHSPQVAGIRRVLWQGSELYRQALDDPELLERYGRGTPDDWIERHLYSRYSALGLGLMLMIDLVCFGAIGLTLWAAQMLWIPFWAAGVVNGLGHWWGYRNFETADASRNLVPWGLLIGGEELHNNHHASPASARLSCRWFELDIGWAYIRCLAWLRLARVKQAGLLTLPTELGPRSWSNRLQLLRLYGQQVLLPTLRQECRQRNRAGRRLLKRARWMLSRDQAQLNASQRECLNRSLSLSRRLATVYEFQTRLRALWQLPGRSSDKLHKAVQAWCLEAKQSGIEALEGFADSLIRAQREALPATA